MFLLFLDCVHQLISQNPSAFEFTDFLLLELYYSVCHCYHHTFVFNTVAERLRAIDICPKDLLVISTFDFSLYLRPEALRLLRNDASIFEDKQIQQLIHYRRISTSPIRSPRDSFSFNAESIDYETISSPQYFSLDLHVDWRVCSLEFWSQCYCRYDQNYLPTLSEQNILMAIDCLRDELDQAKNRFRRNNTVDTWHSVRSHFISESTKQNSVSFSLFKSFYANSWHPHSLDTRV